MTEITGTDACSCDLLANKLNAIIKLLTELQMARSAGVATGVKKTRQKRAPSKYNLFMRDCLLHKKGDSGEHKEKFKQCALEYRKSK